MGLVKRGCRTRAGARLHRALRFGLDFTVTRNALEPSNKHCQVGWTWAVGEGGIQIGSKRGGVLGQDGSEDRSGSLWELEWARLQLNGCEG